ncbi:hypothetical protein J6X13_00060 [Candidatus Saccharibacteria bacterium]|nr:hypothetical protein [Candidatus Saccharibacteria bacterium]
MAELSNKDGLNRCPHCGGSDIATDAKAGKLKCNYCQTVFDAKSANEAGGVEGMKGETRGLGAEDIIPGDDIVKTFKCPACGAEVVLNTEESLSASCHWCRHIFSANEQISNGAVPDLVLPFSMTREEAEKKIRELVEPKMDSLDGEFKAAFKPEDVRGVYFPYMIVDVNAHSTSDGEAEKTVEQKSYPPYKVDEYFISRDFDVLVDDLTVESSSSRLNQDTYVNSNNIINAILPFDTENAVVWNANYLRGFASEKRTVNINNLKEIVALQSGDIARKKARESAADYDRGIHWEHEHLGIKGTKWKAAYLPVWLYSYKGTKDARIYYIAINARTGETVGCLPTHDKRGLNIDARHHHENETRAEVKNMKAEDKLTKQGKKVYTREIEYRNDNRVIGSLSHGRDEMLAIEKGRFQNGANYTHKKASSINVAMIIFWIIFAIMMFAILTGGHGGGSGRHSSSSSSSSWSSSSSSSYDSGSSYSSGSDSSSGFSYSYDY